MKEGNIRKRGRGKGALESSREIVLKKNNEFQILNENGKSMIELQISEIIYYFSFSSFYSIEFHFI